MSTVDPRSLSERRAALVAAARRLLAEMGPEAGALTEPGLAQAVAETLAEDIAQAIERRTAAAASPDELVDGLLDAVLEAAEPWEDALALANVAIERVGDFDRFSDLLSPWLDAVRGAIERGQDRGFVRDDIAVRETALVLRDALDRTAKVALRFRHDGYREATAALVRGALACDGSDAPTK